MISSSHGIVFPRGRGRTSFQDHFNPSPSTASENTLEGAVVLQGEIREALNVSYILAFKVIDSCD